MNKDMVANGIVETNPCECGKIMIKRYQPIVLATYPPQYPWFWWCAGCGRTAEGGVERGITADEAYRTAWEKANE